MIGVSISFSISILIATIEFFSSFIVISGGGKWRVFGQVIIIHLMVLVESCSTFYTRTSQ